MAETFYREAIRYVVTLTYIYLLIYLFLYLLIYLFMYLNRMDYFLCVKFEVRFSNKKIIVCTATELPHVSQAPIGL